VLARRYPATAAAALPGSGGVYGLGSGGGGGRSSGGGRVG